jgi:rod shape-determining protein MreC
VLALLLVLSIVIITLGAHESETGPLHSVRSAFGVVTSPLSRLGAAITVPFRAAGNAISNSSMSGDDIQALKDENDELRATVMQLEEYRQEYQRLSDLLDMKEAYNLDSVGARVIGRTYDSYNQTITLDKGSDDGISSGMPVMNSQGLLGQVESTTGSQSTVRLITDPQSSVSVMLQSSRVEGILQGSSDGLLYLNYVSTSEQVSEGDVVITSGTGGVYPKGIMVGEVTSVTDRKNAVYHTIVVTPLAKNEVFEEVLVVVGTQTEVTNSSATPTPTPSDEGSN